MSVKHGKGTILRNIKELITSMKIGGYFRSASPPMELNRNFTMKVAAEWDYKTFYQNVRSIISYFPSVICKVPQIDII